VVDSTRRQLLETLGFASLLGSSGCLRLISGNENQTSTGTVLSGIQDSDGDGVIDSEDYAPRDPDVQREEQVKDDVTPPESERPTETEAQTTQASESTTLLFHDDFNYESDQLAANGWNPRSSSIQVSNSHLTTDSNETSQWVYKPADGFSEVEIRGAFNNEMHGGLRIILSESRDGTDAVRIHLTIQQNRNTPEFDYGSVNFFNTETDTESGGADTGFGHDGDIHNYRIKRMPDGGAELFINSTSYARWHCLVSAD
jgi:hypothetical protein